MNKKVKVNTTRGFSFGRHVNEPYPHFLIDFRIDYPIIEEFVSKMLN